jgi:hypothetical protein
MNRRETGMTVRMALRSVRLRAASLFLVLAALACVPVWAVKCFMTQDGAAHAYSAALMLRLLDGDAVASQLFAFNPWTMSNSIGHWLLVLLLTGVSSITATKLVVTVTYAGVVAAVGFLRFATVGRDGLLTSLLLGAAIGYNWLWLSGLYNFLLGGIGLAVTLALFHRWQARLSAGRIAGLAVLLLLVYLSHIVAFGVLAGGLILMAAFSEPDDRRRVSLGLLVALVPVAVLTLAYGWTSSDPAVSTERLFPVWRRLSNPWSIPSWLFHIRTADPFFIISRRAFPFSTATSGAFAVFMPLLWLGLALTALAWGTLSRHPAAALAARRRLPLIVLFASCALAAAFGPDDFGTSRGTLLRERLAFLAAMLFVPLYRTGGIHHALKATAHLCLGGVILFQAAALWEYARQTSRDADEFLALGSALEAQDAVASIIILENAQRFPSHPAAAFSSLLGTGSRAIVWDNYQLGYTLFPVVAKDPEDRRFVFDLTSTNVFDDEEPAATRDARLARLASLLAANHSRIGTILMWRRNAQVEAVLGRWYESEPVFEHGRGRIFRRRPDSAATSSRDAHPSARQSGEPEPGPQLPPAPP